MKYNIQAKIVLENTGLPIRNFISLYNIANPATGALVKDTVRAYLNFQPDQLIKEELFRGNSEVSDSDSIEIGETSLEYIATIINDRNITSPNFNNRKGGTGIYKNI